MVAPYSVELIWANNAQTTIANSISNTSTTVNLASGTGILFPAPSAGQGFTGTFTDAATGLLHEIVLVTGRTGDTVTMVRGQEGTTPIGWTANDLFANLWTTGAAETLVQLTALQEQATNYAVDTGSVNSYIVALDPPISVAPSAGTPIRAKIASGNTNTAASVMDAGWGAVSVVRRNGSALIGGELVADHISSFLWNGTNLEWQGSAPATAAAITTGTDTQSYVTPSQLAAAVGSTTPTTQEFTASGVHTYTPTSAAVKYVLFRFVGAGGGGGGVGGTLGPDGAAGGDSIVNGIHAKGGAGGGGNTGGTLGGAGGIGGTGGTGTANIRTAGQDGSLTSLASGNGAGPGGMSQLGPGAQLFINNASADGLDAPANSGGGGGGAFAPGTTQAAGGGGGAEYVELWLPYAASYGLTVGAKGAGGIGTGGGAQTGGDGGDGRVLVTEYYR